MGGYFKRIWGKLGIGKIVMIGKGVFTLRFTSLESCLKVKTDGFQFFDQKPFITQLWGPDMIIDKNAIHKAAIWIKFPSLPLKYWGDKSLFKIAGMIGKGYENGPINSGKGEIEFRSGHGRGSAYNNHYLNLCLIIMESLLNKRWSMNATSFVL